MKAQLTHAEAKAGEKVTVILNGGGISMGYLVDGVVWKTTGSYWAVEAKKDAIPMRRFIRDGGKGYRKAVKKLTGF